MSENVKTQTNTDESDIKSEETGNVDIKTDIKPEPLKTDIKSEQSENEDVDIKTENEGLKEEPNITQEMKVEDDDIKVENVKKEENTESSETEKDTQNNETENITENDADGNNENDVTLKTENETSNIENNENTLTTKYDNNSQDKPQFKKKKRKRPLIRSKAKRRRLQLLKELTITEGNQSVNSPEAAEGLEAFETVEEIEYCLTITNLPKNWSFIDIKNYIDTVCGPVDELEMLKDDKTGKGAIRLSYQTEEECKDAMSNLADKEVEGTKLDLEMSTITLECEDTSENSPEEPLASEEPPQQPLKPWRPDLDEWEIDPVGMYGLKPSFLKSLDITPPLDKWVYVTNFRCEKLELRDILDMAGKVLMCSIFNAPPKYANVMFSHPLEAVQAVSMFNGQMYYGIPLKVVMDRSPVDTVLLPKALNNIGHGLGANGKPMRNITEHYNRFVNNKSASISRTAFKVPEERIEDMEKSESEVTFTVKNVEEFKSHVQPRVVPITGANTVTKSVVTTKAMVTPSKPKVTPSKPTVTPSKPVNQPKSKVTPNAAPPPLMSQNPRQNFPVQNFPRNNFGNRPFAPNQGPGWNGPGPMGPGPMGPGPMGPGPMGPMQGPMGPGPMGPMQGPMGPMQGPLGPRPMGPMQGPMGPMQGQMGPMQGQMGPMQGQMGPMQGQMGPMQGQLGPMQGQMGPMQGQVGPMQGQMGPMQGQMGPIRGQMGPVQGQIGPMQGQIRPMQGNGKALWNAGNEPVQLKLSNMPPKTTFHILCEKMAECGQVISIHLTTPGNAVVTYANKMQADKCYQMYNGKYIEGHVMQVRYS